MRQTTVLNSANVDKKWYVIDAQGLILGRLATQVAMILKGKNKPAYTPHVDCGDNVIIINADKVIFTGNKLQGKIYYKHSQHPGGLSRTTAHDMLKKKPIYPVEHAIKGMLPKNKLGSQLFRNLFVYAGSEHPHEAQKPEKLELAGK
ncbi:50S ribosomal protein L13 [Spiroplasma syrphidicola EA-1]|uniref:Large ribosomal subunit protein uL13 n=1 Tax=Spiroplasma syrphidicola EA-1 TaxID=1276229 RepID=R4UMT2_9MOLU|nr:50S ribosomal protein L13 [Spiroplasma syrphidicola]AGM26556.1 50S ribosomal protein L13 [Spiroplasma syrphidicola EA-1]